MKQVMNYNKDNGLLIITVRIKRFRVLLRKQMIS